MRTTLKRGIGRAGGLNGNGHSTAPPLFGPITRYRQPEPRQRSLVGLVLRGFGWLVLAVAVLGSGVGGGLYLYAHETLASIAPHDPQTKNAVRKLSTPLPSKPAIALVAGYDHRAGTGTNSFAGSNSDTLMLLRADPTNRTLSILSFPRDLAVNIYCHGDTVSTQNRINSAWAVCGSNGPYAAVDTMEHFTGLKINYLITLDFHAFKQIVNHLHGVYMNVDRRYYIAPHTGVSAINLLPGYQKLDGGQALSFVRFRHFDSDIYRTGRQQLFLEALKSRLRSGLSISGVPQLIHDLKQNLEVARGGGGAVTLSELESYMGLAYHLPAGHLFRNQIPITDFQTYVVGGADELTVSPTAVHEAVQQFLHPDLHASQRAGLPGTHVAHPKKKARQIPHKEISVLVLNAGTIVGEAANTTYLLTRQGFDTKTLPPTATANAPGVTHDSTVYYDPVQPNAKEAALELRPLFGSQSRVAQMTTAIADYAKQAGNPKVVAAIGASFHGRLHLPPPPVKVAPHLPPQVSPGISVTAPHLHGITPEVHFPVLAPHLVAQYSQLSSQEGVRVFKPLKRKHEVVMTFVLPSGIQYWQIEETDWTSAPILASPSGQFVYHHQKFLLYTTGGAIQMVVLRTPKATYWVVNTILNQLSNSTMIAIAESLRPLGR